MGLRQTRTVVLSALLTLAAPLVSAHTPYLAPSSFDINKRGIVDLDASFAERFFVPEVAFNNSIFHVISPDGKNTNPDTLVKFKLRTAVEHHLELDGTYRFSTGDRLGRVFKIYELNGERKSLENPTDSVPTGGKLLSFFQSLTKAETYVTKGAPDQAALTPYNHGLEFEALNHPNNVFVGEAIQFRSLFNGKPLADLKVDVFLAKDQFSDEKPTLSISSNNKGIFSFKPTQAGVYLLRARHRSEAPAESVAPEISNTYTLVLEAIQ